MSMFSEYRTVSFDREMMRKGIRIGRLRTDVDGNMVLDHNGQAIFDPAAQLDVTLWLSMVPEAYKQDAVNALEAVGPHWLNTKLTESTVAAFISDLQSWIRANVEPK
jgi:hypothetical protein